MIIWSLITILTSFVLFTVEIDTFANSLCKEKQFVNAFVFINLLILIAIMLLVISLFNLELINKTPYRFKITFLRPWLLLGACPIFEMPLMVYDHYNCKKENPVYTYSDSYSIMNAVGIIFIILFVIFIALLTCIFSGINCNLLMNCFKKTFFYVIFPVILVAMNVMAFILTFTQVSFLLPVLYFHNYAYYFMGILMILFFIMVNGCKMQEKFHFNEKIMEFSKINK